MIIEEILKILLEDWEYKKVYESDRTTLCDCCHDNIYEGDTFYFFAVGKKICENCKADIMDYLEEEE